MKKGKRNMHKDSFEKIPHGFLKKWQEIADLIANILNVPAALIMKTENEFMEVFTSGKAENNPYKVGDKEQWRGLYCETVIKTQKKLRIPNALKDKNWNKNPDIKLGMIAYLGYPINFPNQDPFGTLCVLDNKERHFSTDNERLLVQFKKVLELDLAFILSLELKGNYSHAGIIQKLSKDNEKLRTTNKELKKTEEALITSAKKLKHSHDLMNYIIKHNRSAVAVHDRDLKYIYVSQRYIDDFKIKESDLIGKQHYEVFPDIPHKWREVHQKALAGEVISAEEDPFYREDGSIEWTRWECRPWHESDGSIGGIIIYTEVINERKQAEEIIRQAHETYQGIINGVTESIYIQDEEGVFLEVNNAAIKSHGLKREDLIGKTPDILSAEGKNDMPLIAEMIKKAFHGEPQRFEFWGRNADGKVFPDEVTLTKGVYFGKNVVIALTRNIAERKQAEERNNLLASIIERSNDFIGVADANQKPMFVNRAGQKMLGLDGEEAVRATKIEDYFMPEDLPFVRETITPTLNKQGRWAGEFRLRHFKTGKPIPVLYDVFKTINHHTGEVTNISTVTRDISRIKQAEEKIRRNQQLLQSISDNMFDLVALTDMNGNYTFASASHKILGYETDKLIGTNVMEYVHPDDFPVVMDAFKKFIANKEDTRKVDYRNRCADGSYLWFETIGRFICDEKGNPQQILFNSRDITERRRADEALHESEERFRMLADLAPVGIIITDENQNPAYVSPAFTKIFGYTIQDIPTVSDWFCLAYPDEDRRNKVKLKWFEFTERVKDETGDSKPLEHPVHCKNGSEKHIEFRLAISGGIHVIIFTDITERKKVQEEMARERMQLLSIFNSIDEIIYITDIETHEILYINKKSEEILKKNCIGKKCYKEFQNLDSPCSFCTNSIIKNNNEQSYYWDFHNHFINKHYAITDRLIDWPDGRKVRFEIAIDVTQQKIAEQALRESEERFRSLFENATIGIYRTSPDGKILMANPTLVKMLGYNSFDELEKRNLLPEGFESKTPGNIFQQQIEEKGEVRAIESAWKIKDGSTVFVSESARAFRDKKGDILYYEGTVEDITKRKKAEEKVLMLSKGIEQSPAILVITDRNGTIEYVNPMFTKVTGYSTVEALGKNPRILKSGNHSKEFYRDLWETILRGKDWQGEILNKKKDGTTFWESTIISPIFDKNGQITHFMAIKEDITYRKQAEEVHKELEIANKTARFKQNFLANMSHEIRTPLTGVLGMIEIMEQTSLTIDQKDYLNTIKTSGENLREIINQVLDYSKIEAGKVSIYPRVFEFTYLPQSAMSLYKNNVNAGVKLQSTIDPKIPVWIEADKARLSQVFNNLLSNAVKFTSQGAITIESSLVSSEPDTGQIIIKVEVSDTGLGIPEDLQRKLFIPFSQIEAIDIRNYEGTGLGLSICKQLIELMEGEIGVISQEGKGSTFWFTFPAKTAHKPKEPIQKDGASVSAKKLHILLAEDKMVNQKVVKLMLTSMGHKVRIAKNGQEAIELYQPDRFDLILMDIQMPVMDGVTATQKLKEMHKNLPPIVGLSANAFEGDREKYMTLGMDEYLTKPVKKKDILALLEKL
ncbi:MAG: PAS domain S-box protein [Bacteroidetes bacterium]|nr:MAG: PAS domain S-box protein [Bacteroidota bacterium]